MVDLLPTVIGFNGYQLTSHDPANPVDVYLDIPSDALPGDLLVVSINAYPHTITAPTPSRGLAELWFHDVDLEWAYGIWAGPWDGDPTPIHLKGSGYDNPTGQFFGAFIACYRDILDPTRPAVFANGPTVPGLPGAGPAICINWTRAALGGVTGYTPFLGTDWDTSQPTYVNASYTLGTAAHHGGVVNDQTSTDSHVTGWPFVSFGVTGITVAPPCRLYPREDQLGVGSGRIWPAPRSQQASPRRAGGYY